MSSIAESNHLENNNRWRLNNHGQLVDADAASTGWDLADEIVRLKIGDVGEDGPIRPSSKVGQEVSPAETASSITSSPGQQLSVSHSRGSSTDISLSSSTDSSGAVAAEPTLSFKGNVVEVKERPHSFSGGLSSADLRRLQQAGGPEVTDHLQQQQQQWAAAHNITSDDKQLGLEQQPSYPSLINTNHRPQAPPQDYRSSGQTPATPSRDDLMQQIDYNIQQRAAMSPATATGQGLPFGRSNNIPSPLYRQPPRAFPQQNVIPSPTAMGYPGVPSMTLGNSQQLYDMMLPPHETMNPAVSRVQQQHNVFRGAHQHSTSDPSALRDAATLALLNGNMQFNPAMFTPGLAAPPGMPMYANQFYRAQDAYRPDPAMAARLAPQYTGPYGMVAPAVDPVMGSPTTSQNGGQNGPSANNRKLGLYKTELCRSWEEKGSCRYGAKCQFAHGEEELRNVTRHPKYKTEICRTFWVSGSCPYGKRCCFIHTELPTSGNGAAASTTGSDSAPPPNPDGRARSMSTNSDPNDASVSLLARISAKRSQESSTNASSTPVDTPSGFQFTRPPTGSLRVDTSALDTSIKQNKSAYPTFTRNGVLLPAQEEIKAKSPGPVTAGPDLGRHNSSRLEIVGYNQRNPKASTPPSTSSRNNSIGGVDELNFSPSPVSGHSYTLSSGGEGTPTTSQPRANGHVRAGSAGNWASMARANLASSSFPSPGGETISSPWSTTELAVGSSRFTDKAWA